MPLPRGCVSKGARNPRDALYIQCATFTGGARGVMADLAAHAEMPGTSGHERLLHRIRAEFLEMPGLRLTRQQASRLWHLDHTTCERVLQALVLERFLLRTAGGAFVRADRS